MKHLEEQIRILLNQITDTNYIGHLEVKHENGIYVLNLGLGNKDAKPLSMAYQGDASGFISFLAKELRKKKFTHSDRNTVTLINGESPMYYPIIEL